MVEILNSTLSIPVQIFLKNPPGRFSREIYTTHFMIWALLVVGLMREMEGMHGNEMLIIEFILYDILITLYKIV